MKATLCTLTCSVWLAGALNLQAQSPVITSQPQDVSACAGGNATFHVEIAFEPLVEFHWFWKGFLMSSGVVSSQTNSSLTLSNVQFFDNASQVHVIISTPGGGTQSSNVFLHVPDPYICHHPTNTSVPVGGTIQFNVNAVSMWPLTYQWWFQGFPNGLPQALANSGRISGANSPGLTILNALTTDAGKYWVTVSDWTSLILTSRVAQCFVGPPPTVTNALSRIVRISTGTTFVPTYGGPGPRTYQWYRNDIPIPGAINQTLVLTNIQRPEVGLYHVVVSNPGGSAASDKAHLQVRISLDGTTPIFREEATDEMPSLTNAVVASFAPPPTAVFHGVPLLFSTYNAAATVGEASRCGVPASHSMWVLYTSPRTEITHVSTEGSDFDTVLAVHTWDGNPNHTPVQIACDNDSGYDGYDSVTNFPAVVGQNYYIVVDGVGGAKGTARLQVGQNIRKFVYNRTNGSFRFELAGPFWYDNTLRGTTMLPPPSSWINLRVMPATNRDWIIGYTNTTAAVDQARFYSVNVNTNSAPP